MTQFVERIQMEVDGTFAFILLILIVAAWIYSGAATLQYALAAGCIVSGIIAFIF